MVQYSENEKLRLLSFPLEKVLSSLGYRTDHLGYMYFSPFRGEDTPSFHIDSRTNRWFDFGLSEGGGVVDLVCRLCRCPRSEALSRLAQMDSCFSPSLLPAPDRNVPAARAGDSGIRILSVTPGIRREVLLRYAVIQRRIQRGQIPTM